MKVFICKFCNQQFDFEKPSAAGGHARNCEKNPKKAEANAKGRIKQKIHCERKTKEFRESYELNPKKCIFCESVIRFEKRGNKFCSHTCAAQYNNTHRTCKKYELSEKGLANIREASKKRSEAFGYTVKTKKEIKVVKGIKKVVEKKVVIRKEDLYNENPNVCLICNEKRSFEKIL